MSKLVIIIATFNEGERLHETLRVLRAKFLDRYRGAKRVVLVDDCSTDPVRLDALPDIGAPLALLRHPVNLGAGGAMQTAITYALADADASLFVTLDADGQHDPASIDALLEPLRNDTSDIVFGSRFIEGCETMPRGRRVLLRAATVFERWLTGLRLSDAHNGFRAFNRRTAATLQLRQNRMAHATEIKQTVARAKLRYSEVPVAVTYSAESLAKGQRNIGSLVILKDLVKSYLFNG
jgi:glycosyltransferase involved in cell wall biosynthesis